MLGFVLFVLAMQDVALGSFAGEWLTAAGDTAKMALNPGSEVKKLARDVNDFAQFPDKSKLPQRSFTWAEVAQFDGEQGRPMYLAIGGVVYDFTTFGDLHPGGPGPIKKHAGKDASTAMSLCSPKMASDVLQGVLKRFKVGTVVDIRIHRQKDEAVPRVVKRGSKSHGVSTES